MEKFGLLTFIEDVGSNAHKKRLWRLRCDCGLETIAIASQVRGGHTKSCGHLQSAGNNRKHGLKRTRLYTIWSNMRSRCNNPQNLSYKNYGGRGIQVSPAWDEFLVFAKDVGEPPTKTATLDRIDNNKNYSPENVRWAERDVQARNTRQNVNVSIDGIEKCLHDWCGYYGIAPGSVYRRLATGESMVSAITRPKAKRFR